MGAVNAVVMVEGLPGSGKSTTAQAIATWLAEHEVEVQHWTEGRVDHPVDFEQVAVLGTEKLLAMAAESPETRRALLAAAEQRDDVWLVRHALHPTLPAALVERLRTHDAYDGDLPAEVHSRVLIDSWRRFGRTRPAAEPGIVHVWECVLLQNPVCALVARADQPTEMVRRHVAALVDAVRSHAPALVYLDAGEPRPVLERAAAERPAEWLELVIDYHTRQGRGRRRGLDGFDGYVEFMRERRALELEVVAGLDLPTLVVPVGDGRREEHAAAVRAFVAEHLGLARGTARPEPDRVA